VIRIAIGAMPQLLRSIVSSALETEGDFTLMAPPASGLCETGQADVLIVCRDRDPDQCIPVGELARSDAPAIVAIDSHGASARILHIVAETAAITAASDLCAAVRLAARQRAGTTN
jgi:hypothetical protein